MEYKLHSFCRNMVRHFTFNVSAFVIKLKSAYSLPSDLCQWIAILTDPTRKNFYLLPSEYVKTKYHSAFIVLTYPVRSSPSFEQYVKCIVICCIFWYKSTTWWGGDPLSQTYILFTQCTVITVRMLNFSSILNIHVVHYTYSQVYPCWDAMPCYSYC